MTTVIPTFNDAPKHLADAVQSAQGQTCTYLEIVVVDDGSDDPVAMDEVMVIRQANAGVSAARNRGIRAAAGEFIITLDADDRLSPNYAQESVAVLQSDPSATAAYPRVQEFGEKANLWWPGVGREVHLKEFAVHTPIAVASAFRRVDWEAVGGFDESLRLGHENYELFQRA